MTLPTYTEYRPPADLSAWVACLWQINGSIADGHTLAHRVLPDGCADLVFEPDSSALVGPMSSATVVELRGEVDVMGIRFRPGSIGTFAGMAADQLLDAALPRGELSLALELSDAQLFASDGLAQRLELLTRLCRRRISTLPPPDPLIRHALAYWLPTGASDLPTVAAVTVAVALSERAFERRFIRSVGMPPARYRRLARFRRLLAQQRAGHGDWATSAAAAGYSDQPHLIRDFRAFAGVTPTEWSVAQAAHAGFVQDARVTTV
jgi:AraC-like DNA-binding protein